MLSSYPIIDACYIVSFAIIMLNTSLHNPNVKNKVKTLIIIISIYYILLSSLPLLSLYSLSFSSIPLFSLPLLPPSSLSLSLLSLLLLHPSILSPSPPSLFSLPLLPSSLPHPLYYSLL